jgi:hypothetical protein
MPNGQHLLFGHILHPNVVYAPKALFSMNFPLLVFGHRWVHSLFWLFLLATSSCISLKRYSRYVNEGVRNIATEDMSQTSNIRFAGSPFAEKGPVITHQKKRELFVPALVFWYWESTFKSQFQPGFADNLFQLRLLAEAEKQGIRRALESRILELEVKNVPDDFVFSHQGMLIYAVFVYATSQNEFIRPSEKTPTVSYKLKTDSLVLKAGQVTVKNPFTRKAVNPVRSTRRFTQEYLTTYQSNLDALAEATVRALRAELKTELGLPDLPEPKSDSEF